MSQDDPMVPIRGRTYPVKDAIKALGGRWDADARCWRVPESKEAEARALVAGPPAVDDFAAREEYRPRRPRQPEWPPLPEGHIDISRGEGYGGEARPVGAAIVAGTYGVGAALEPAGSVWIVTRARSIYYRDDGMSFGVGDERGYVYVHRVRPATEEEAAPILAALAARREREEAAAALSIAARAIRTEGEYPEGSHRLDGEWLLIPGSGKPLYGTGTWLVLCSDSIWTVENNGMDGDDWSRNNVQTHGAGAVGHRVPADAELAARIRELAAAAGKAGGPVPFPEFAPGPEPSWLEEEG